MRNKMKHAHETRSFLLGLLTVATFLFKGNDLLSHDLMSPLGILSVLILFAVTMVMIFAVVRHADALAHKLGEPYGTLILTLSVVLLEVAMISSVMLTGSENPVMARDTMFAVVMGVMNGLVGITLLIGGLRYHSQAYNVQGLKAYIAAIIPVVTICLILPNFTSQDSFGGMSTVMIFTLIVTSLLLYGVFLFIQTKSHTDYFINDVSETEHEHHETRSIGYHALFLVANLALVIGLAKSIAIPIDQSINTLGAPSALGGLIVAMIILSPEGVGAIKAALNNQLQRAMNLFYGSVLATISLTVPAVLLIAVFLGETVILGLGPADMVLLVATILVSMMTFSSGRTHPLNGATHLVLFIAYVVLMFD
ncbi:TPA: calcium:proton antiporter [Vibrio vulnificus]|uniref:Ca2+/H+ antiporter n=2 Tax=Vibrio vulnificus TaxID=672 RepID=A0A3Q0L016_VIBVU|nr:Ca2+/H+ antiporter [Vibrio vulnificus CMCP6]EGR0047717.1 calcium:proton antiporter [Vibrio vulnificus]POC23519.1 calcium:proton antiporter [Vibrio vulnificus]POF54814.1 calcium:proton antiporter [Vibrio vulnificus]QBN16240.1 calcium:proton antiporter [Vibrio vulnificus]